MTDIDIVERLRSWSARAIAPSGSNTLKEAADEIDRLRAALDEVKAELLAVYQRAWEKEQ